MKCFATLLFSDKKTNFKYSFFCMLELRSDVVICTDLVISRRNLSAF